MENLSSKTVKELTQYAEDNGVDLDGAKTKTKILSIILGVESNVSEAKQADDGAIQMPKTKKARVSNSSSNEDGVIIVRSAEQDLPPVKREKTTPKVENTQMAVYASKHLHWQGVGKLTPGYNILSKEVAEKWLTNKNVREATPQEVATYYGKN
jgi:hypothetical protein